MYADNFISDAFSVVNILTRNRGWLGDSLPPTILLNHSVVEEILLMEFADFEMSFSSCETGYAPDAKTACLGPRGIRSTSVG